MLVFKISIIQIRTIIKFDTARPINTYSTFKIAIIPQIYNLEYDYAFINYMPQQIRCFDIPSSHLET